MALGELAEVALIAEAAPAVLLLDGRGLELGDPGLAVAADREPGRVVVLQLCDQRGQEGRLPGGMQADQPDVPAHHVAVSLGVEAPRPAPPSSRRDHPGPRLRRSADPTTELVQSSRRLGGNHFRAAAAIGSDPRPPPGGCPDRGTTPTRRHLMPSPPGVRRSAQSVCPWPPALSRKIPGFSARRPGSSRTLHKWPVGRDAAPSAAAIPGDRFTEGKGQANKSMIIPERRG